MSISQNIIKLLEIHDKLTIKEIIEKLEMSDKSWTVRKEVYRLLEKDKIVKNGKKGRAYYFSLKEKALDNSEVQLKFLKELVNRGAIKFYRTKLNAEELKQLEAI